MKLFSSTCILVTLALAGYINALGQLSEIADEFFGSSASTQVIVPTPTVTPVPVPTPSTTLTPSAPVAYIEIVSDETGEPAPVETITIPDRPVTIFFLQDSTDEIVASPVPVEADTEPLLVRPTSSPEVVVPEPVDVEEEEPVTTPVPAPATVPTPTPACITAAEGMRIAGDFTLFLEALEITELLELFEDPEVVGTLFAVQDKYFNSALGQFNLDAETFFADAFLDRVMAYHVLNEIIQTEDMIEGEPLKTALPDAELFVNRDDADGIEIVPIVTQFNATLLEKNISLCNTIVHVIDNLLIPSFNEEGEALPHPGVDVTLPLTPTVVEEDIIPVVEEPVVAVGDPVYVTGTPAPTATSTVPSSGTTP